MDIENHLTSLNINKKNVNKISGIYTNSKAVVPNSVFVALKGRKHDGHNHLKEAIEKGASVLVVETNKTLSQLSYTGAVCVVPSTRQVLTDLLNEFYNFPSEKMFCVGVTGTNGKSTVSQMLSHIFSHCGWKTGLIGTVNTGLVLPLKNSKNRITKTTFKNLKNSILTTPDSTDLYNLLNQFYQEGAQATVMEASSIGLNQKRTEGVDFNMGVFTNLTTDHLDYHRNMEAYFQAKRSLFEPSLLKGRNTFFDNTRNKSHFLGVLNFDDPYGIKIAKSISLPYVSYGSNSSAHFRWEMVSGDLSHTLFKIHFNKKTTEIYLPIPGTYNISNATAALCSSYFAGFSIDKSQQALQSFPGVKGRLKKISDEPQVFVDYAHTPKALELVLNFLNGYKKPNNRLIVVFGCGGERDKLKRSPMTKIATRISDLTILTSDNPREEDPLNIINDCTKDINNTQKILVELDRKQAIEKALKSGDSKDIVLIAGKGHETEQIIGKKRYPFDDAKITSQILTDLS